MDKVKEDDGIFEELIEVLKELNLSTLACTKLEEKLGKSHLLRAREDSHSPFVVSLPTRDHHYFTFKAHCSLRYSLRCSLCCSLRCSLLVKICAG